MPQPSEAASTEPAEVPIEHVGLARVPAELVLHGRERPDRPGGAEHAARAEHQSASRHAGHAVPTSSASDSSMQAASTSMSGIASRSALSP